MTENAGAHVSSGRYRELIQPLSVTLAQMPLPLPGLFVQGIRAIEGRTR